MSRQRQRPYNVRFSKKVQVVFVPKEDRAGSWHLHAVDRERFQRRCRTVEPILSRVLDPEHRRTIYDSLIKLYQTT